MSNKWIGIVNKDGKKMIERKLDSVIDKVAQDLRNLNITKDNIYSIEEYKKRKLVKEATVKYFIMKKGPKFSLEAGDCEEVAVLNEEYLKRGE